MAITKKSNIDQIEIVGDYKIVQLREVTIISEDGTELTRSFHRNMLYPTTREPNGDGTYTYTDTDISGETQEVKDICAVVWTDAVKAAYRTFQEANPPPSF